MCLLVKECYCIIQLVDKKQILNSLLSYNRPKRLSFFSWGAGGGWKLLLRFKKIVCGSNISIRIHNWFLDLKNF